MNLIEVLRVFKPGMCVYRASSAVNAIPVFHSHEALHAFLAGMPNNDFTATDWVAVLGDTAYGCFVTEPPEQYQCLSRFTIVKPEKEKRPFSSGHLLALLRRELDIPDRRDVIVRELWLTMQLLATPESCADFMRRSLVIG